MSDLNYDARPLTRLSNDDAVLDEIRERIAAEVLPGVQQAIARLSREIASEHSLSAEDASLLVARLMAEAADLDRWIQSGRLRAAGAPVRAVVAGLGYASNSSVQRQLGTDQEPGLIRRADLAAREAARAGRPQTITDGAWKLPVAPVTACSDRA